MLDELDAMMERMLNVSSRRRQGRTSASARRDVLCRARRAPCPLASLTMPTELPAQEIVVETPQRERVERSAPKEMIRETAAELAAESAKTSTEAVADSLTFFRDSELPDVPSSLACHRTDANPFGPRDELGSDRTEQDDRLDAAGNMDGPHFFPDSFQDQMPPPLVVRRPMKIVTAPDSPRPALGNLCLRPLVWANQSFDQCTTLLGPLGRSLRGSRGRSFLGILGLISLMLAGAWLALEHMGWP